VLHHLEQKGRHVEDSRVSYQSIRLRAYVVGQQRPDIVVREQDAVLGEVAFVFR